MKLWNKTRPEAAVAAAPRFPGVRAAMDAVSAGSRAASIEDLPGAPGTMAAASLAGERVTRFASGPEVLAMHASMHAAAGRRLTCVLNVAARAVTRQARSAQSGHDDYHAIDDAGFFQVFARDVQETADLNLIAHRVAELSLNPGLVAQDGSLTPHAIETLLRPEDALVAEYLGDPADRIASPTRAQRLVFGETRRRIPEMFDLDYPASLGVVQNQDSYAQGVAAQRPFYFDHIAEIADQAFHEFATLTGRLYARASGHRLEDAEWVIVAQGSVVSDAEAVADHLRRERGLRVGVLNLTMFRPFPADLVTAMLAGKKGALVLERVDQPLAVDPPLLREIRAAMSKGLENGRHSMSHPGLFALGTFDVPEFYSACFGLGGRDLSAGDIVAAVDSMRRDGAGPRHVYLGIDFVRAGTRLPKLQIWQETLVERYPHLPSLALESASDLSLLPKDALAVRLHTVGGRGASELGRHLALVGFELFGLQVKARPRGGSEKIGQPATSSVVFSSEPIRPNAAPRRVDVVLAPDPSVFRHADPLEGLVEGGALIVQTALPPEAFWNTLPVKARRAILERKVRVWCLDSRAIPSADGTQAAWIGAFLNVAPFRARWGGTEDALFEAAGRVLTKAGDDRAAEDRVRAIRRGFSESRVLVPPPGEAADAKGEVPHPPAGIESPRAQKGPGHEGRFWEQVGSVRELGQDGIADPFAALGVIPAATAAVRDMSRARVEVPEFNGTKCTGCAECWTQCPDAAIPGLVSSVEHLLAAAIDAGGESGPLERLRPIARNWGREAHKVLQKDAAVAPGLAFALAYDTVASKMGWDAERRASADAEFAIVQARIAEFPLARTRPFFDDPESKSRGTGGLLSITVNPDACKGCNLCVEVCPEGALVAIAQDERAQERLRRNWALWNRLPDTDDRYLGGADDPSDKAVLSSLLLKKQTYRSMTGGDGACQGCGEKTAAHLVLSAIHAHLAPRVAKQVAALGRLIEELDAKARAMLAAGADLRAAAAAQGAVSVPVKETERRQLEQINAAADGLRDLLWRYTEGPGGKGRALLAMAGAEGCSATWASTYPYNPYAFPWVSSLEADAPTVALGLFDAHMRRMAAGFVAVRRAVKVLDGSYDAARDEAAFAAFDWTRFSDEEFLLCPPLLAMAGDGAMLDRGFDGLSRLLSSGKPVRVVVLDTQGSSDASGRPTSGSFPGYRGRTEARKELALLAIAHRGVFVHQSSQASPAHLMKGVLEGLRTRGPALFNLYAPCPMEQGFSARASTRAARLALESRAFPFLTHDPAAGPALADRLRLDGNPSPEADWPVYTLRYLDEQNVERKLEAPLTIADWAATEGRFAPHFTSLPREEWDGAVAFAEYVRLPRAERLDKTAFIHTVDADRRLSRQRVAPAIAALADERRDFWSELRELAGLSVSKAARKTLAAEFDSKMAALRAEHEARLAELKREYPRQIARQLAEGLIKHGGGGALSELLASLPSAGPSVRPAPKAKTEGPAPAPSVPVPAAPPPEPTPAAAPAAAAPPPKDDEPLTLEAYIDSARCTTCNECTNLNKRMFAYNAAKQAEIKDVSAGTFQQLVLAAERCPVSIIHPGTPINPDEKDLEKWVKRAARFN